MKVFFVLASCAFAVASASRIHLGAPIAAISTGTSSQFRSEDNYGNYNFGYDESHATGSTSRREESSNGVQRGSYALSDADGRRRIVNYIADDSGFHATIQTNEPGVEPKDPADVLINKAAPVAIAPVAPIHVAPAPILAAPAPIPAPAPLPAPLPAPSGIKGIFRAAPIASYPVPAPVAQVPIAIEEPESPRAFSYAFGATHLAPQVYGPAPLPAPAAPIYQQRIEDY